MNGYEETKEQILIGEKVVDSIREIDRGERKDYLELFVFALAGAGKSSTIVSNIEKIKDYDNDAKIQGLTFNTASAKDLRVKLFEKGVRNAPIQTLDAFAIKLVNSANRTVEEARPNYKNTEISPTLGTRNTGEVRGGLSLLTAYLNSECTDPIEHYLAGHTQRSGKDFAIDIYNMMDNGEIKKTFDFFKKKLQLGLYTGKIKLPTYDFLFIDEHQDSNPLTVSIFKMLNAKVKFAVGDVNQRINSFRNSTYVGYNPMSPKFIKDNFPNAETLTLSRSFRLVEGSKSAKKITAIANNTLGLFTKEKIKLKAGKKRDSSFKEEKIEDVLFLSRTNAQLINGIAMMVEKKVFFKTVRSPKQIFELALSIGKLTKRESPKNKNRGDSEALSYKFKYLEKFVEEYKVSLSESIAKEDLPIKEEDFKKYLASEGVSINEKNQTFIDNIMFKGSSARMENSFRKLYTNYKKKVSLDKIQKEGISEDDLLEYIKEQGKVTNELELRWSAKAVEEYGLEKLETFCKVAEENYMKEIKCSVFLATAHSTKGLEYDKVLLAEDFPDIPERIGKMLAREGATILRGKVLGVEQDLHLHTYLKMVEEEVVPDSIIDEINLLYVAVTRAKKEINFNPSFTMNLLNPNFMEISATIGKHYREEISRIGKYSSNDDILSMAEAEGEGEEHTHSSNTHNVQIQGKLNITREEEYEEEEDEDITISISH